MERKEEKKNNWLGYTAIVEVYKIMQDMQRLGKEQKLIASSNKGPKEQQLDLRNFKAIEEEMCSCNIITLQNFLLPDCCSFKKLTQVPKPGA